MSKVWTIAKREYSAMVATKAFLLSITIMPVLMLGGVVVLNLLKDVQDVSDKVIVVADGTGGELFDPLERAAESRNAVLGGAENQPLAAPRYVLERFDEPSLTDDDRLALSDRVRREELAAFVEIPTAILSQNSSTEVKFYCQNPALSSAGRWVDRMINELATSRRLAELEIDAEKVKQATAPVPVTALGLFKRTTGGGVRGADASQNMLNIFLPFGFLMLMFMVIFLSAQPMLESVLEEKSERIAEVLLGSASPFQLMAGKLLGNVAGSLSVVALYGIGGYAVAAYNDWTAKIPFELIPWFLIYQIIAVLLFSSVFMAVGAAVTQLKEAQSLLLPVWLLLCLPMFVWLQVVREPNGEIATWMSFFPPAIPMVMVLRLASEAAIPLWQILLGLALLVATTVCCVYVAGRIFRIGILWKGKTPRTGELFRWAFAG